MARDGRRQVCYTEPPVSRARHDVFDGWACAIDQKHAVAVGPRTNISVDENSCRVSRISTIDGGKPGSDEGWWWSRSDREEVTIRENIEGIDPRQRSGGRTKAMQGIQRPKPSRRVRRVGPDCRARLSSVEGDQMGSSHCSVRRNWGLGVVFIKCQRKPPVSVLTGEGD